MNDSWILLNHYQIVDTCLLPHTGLIVSHLQRIYPRPRRTVILDTTWRDLQLWHVKPTKHGQLNRRDAIPKVCLKTKITAYAFNVLYVCVYNKPHLSLLGIIRLMFLHHLGQVWCCSFPIDIFLVKRAHVHFCLINLQCYVFSFNVLSIVFIKQIAELSLLCQTVYLIQHLRSIRRRPSTRVIRDITCPATKP